MSKSAIDNAPPHACVTMLACLEDERVPVIYDGVHRLYAVRIDNGPPDYVNPVQRLDYCPWCGVRLPADLWEQWYDELEALLGDRYDLSTDPSGLIPVEYRSDRWWRGRYDDIGDLV